MNVFILDRNMEKSAQMLDDAHLKAQINEACQILMANYNRENYPDAKIGHVNHPVTVYCKTVRLELCYYLKILLKEYKFRFGKEHQNYFWLKGFWDDYRLDYYPVMRNFCNSKTYINGQMTDDIEAIRKYISTKPMKKQPTWTNREKPDWWEV